MSKTRFRAVKGFAAALALPVAASCLVLALHAGPATKTYTTQFTASCNAHGAATVNIYVMDASGSTLATASMECTPGVTATATATTTEKPASFFAAWSTFAVVNGAWVASTPYDADMPHKVTECATDPATGTTGCATVSR